MALTYERTWYFMPAQSFSVPSGSPQLGGGKFAIYTLKRMLAGDAGVITIPNGAKWVVEGSSDGSAYGTADGVDRWTSTAAVVNGGSNTTSSWLTMVSPALPTGQVTRIYLGGASFGASYTGYSIGISPNRWNVGGSALTRPLPSAPYNWIPAISGATENAYCGDATGPYTLRAYGAMSSLGDFIFWVTAAGRVVASVAMVSVATPRANDPHPWLGWRRDAANNVSWPLSGSVAGSYANGSITGLAAPGISGVNVVSTLIPSGLINYNILDAMDGSLMAAPTHIYAGDNGTGNSPWGGGASGVTRLYYRGRVPDVYFAGYYVSTVGPATTLTTVVRDPTAGNIIRYVLLDCVLVPYNDTVV